MNTATVRQPFGVDPSDLTQKTSTGVGTASTGVTATEYGNAQYHKTVLSFTDLAVGSAVGAADLAFGKLLYTMDAGVQETGSVAMNLALTGTATIVGDTPEVGIGSVLGAGDQATLGVAGATMEDYWEGTASEAISGANSVTAVKVATAGALTGIALNEVGSAKTFHLNVADGWAGAGDVTATGTVTILWKSVE